MSKYIPSLHVNFAARKFSLKKVSESGLPHYTEGEMSNYLLSVHVNFAARKSSLKNVSESGQPHCAEWTIIPP